MIIAISQKNCPDKHGSPVDSLENAYVRYFESFGATLLPIPNAMKKPASYFNRFGIDGIVLSGGNTINPALYGQKSGGLASVSKERDKTEKSLLETAVRTALPVLGICRGMQFINVFFGGKLVSIKDGVKNPLQHVASTHA
ncbi:MAG: gamma-glutamyl-gamma-aminobutyrate hydrolase family protein, partial [Candidatus Diapherotrites archaeon]|nr:gamma-glutamyl-gamma-aminobutyrate hydrolase family protein [Candidatus Diapherotrites archaeon]